MKLIRYAQPNHSGLDPFFHQALPAMSRFASLWDDWFESAQAPQAPRADFYEDEQHYFIRAELPGINREALELNLDKHVLTLQVAEAQEDESDTDRYRFSRAFSLPEDVHEEAISAALEDGILTVTLPKAESSKTRQITVK